ncbi:MAG: hypothetical protein JXR59_09495 [Desulfuromonadaceae bacterium]|nr:hypothetical protein [Desulfuromonadaceae bacterium]
MTGHHRLLFILATCALLLSSGLQPSAMAQSKNPVQEIPLTDSDCIKCHRAPSLQIRDNGGAHKTEIGCFDCHEGHPPAGKAVIPQCSNCHAPDDRHHFALANCQSCHAPHAPGITDLSVLPEAKPACLTCHDRIGQRMADKPSLHAEQNCIDCHQQHGLSAGQFSTCLDCHEAHQAGMSYQDCLGCHDPHQPTDYQWRDNTPSDWCAACHEEPVANLKKEGAAHASEIACIDCHQNHPPAQENVIPSCNDCHAKSDAEHYRVGNCSACHNPHKPLAIDMSSVSPVKPVCLSCHAGPGREMTAHTSAHTDMDCSECHAQHGEAMSCLDCHSGHNASMNYDDCLACHRPHSPTYLQLEQGKVKSTLCASCHKAPMASLSSNTTRHAKLDCVFCHRRTHKVILSCDNCHGEPHDSSIHQQFRDCSRCHQGPHDLRN